ncbi:MAG: hypothetical protein ACXWJD_11160, partial [Burkholderiaceae bacterium]
MQPIVDLISRKICTPAHTIIFALAVQQNEKLHLYSAGTLAQISHLSATIGRSNTNSLSTQAFYSYISKKPQDSEKQAPGFHIICTIWRCV